MNETILGKISEVYFGKREGKIGLFLTLHGSWSVMTGYECWDPEEIIPDKNHEWDEKDRDKELTLLLRKVSKLLKQAKVNDVSKLLNVPVEFTTEKGMLKEWRILEEVL